METTGIEIKIVEYGTIEPHSSSSSYSRNIESNSSSHGIENYELSHIDSLPDVFHPDYESMERVSSQTTAILNILATVVGGGTLSLPFAFKNCGMIMAILLTFFSIRISIVSLQFLCVLSRKYKTNNYADIMDKAIGKGVGNFSNVLLIFMLLCVVVAFMVLSKDILGNVIDFAFSSSVLGAKFKSIALLVAVILTFPLMASKDLHALRHVSFLGISSVIFLLFVILWKSFCSLQLYGSLRFQQIRMWPISTKELLTSLPIILIAFMCQFNILGVYSRLSEPTAGRINRVIDVSMMSAGLLYILFGVAGYFLALDWTLDNILNNFSPQDPSLLIARCGLLVTLLCQIPMIVVPCRDSITHLWQEIYPTSTTTTSSISTSSMSSHPYQSISPSIEVLDDGDTTFSSSFASPTLWSRIQEHFTPTRHRHSTTSSTTSSTLPLTFAIVSFSLILAQYVPGVSLIWSLAGSSISLILAFVLPSLSYLLAWKNLGKKRKWSFTVFEAVMLLIISAFMIALCTTLSVQKMMTPIEPLV